MEADLEGEVEVEGEVDLVVEEVGEDLVDEVEGEVALTDMRTRDLLKKLWVRVKTFYITEILHLVNHTIIQIIKFANLKKSSI